MVIINDKKQFKKSTHTRAFLFLCIENTEITASTTTATQPQTTSDSYNAMTVTHGKNTYTLPQLITTLSSIGMSDENIERFLNSNGIR